MNRQERALRTFAVYAKGRDSKKVTDYWVSKQIGATPSTICDWKHGRTTPKVDKLLKISRLLEIPLEAFLVE